MADVTNVEVIPGQNGVAPVRVSFGPRDNEVIPAEWASWILVELRKRKAPLFRQLLLDACANFMLGGDGK